MRRGASLRSSPKPLTRGDWPGHDRYALTERRHKVLGLGIAERWMGSVIAALTSAQVARRMMAILAADVVDYSRLTEAGEVDTHVRLRALRVETIDPCVVSYRGRIIKNTGDGFLASFDSAVDAVRCAIELQREVTESEAALPADRKIRLRLAGNVGQVITEAEDIFGTSVNTPARLEQFSPPGGVVVSATALSFVKTTLD